MLICGLMPPVRMISEFFEQGEYAIAPEILPVEKVSLKHVLDSSSR